MVRSLPLPPKDESAENLAANFGLLAGYLYEPEAHRPKPWVAVQEFDLHRKSVGSL